MVRDFQSVIGEECLVQMPEMTGRQPDYVLACIGGGSNATGIFHPFLNDEGVKIIGVEASGHGMDTDKHAAANNGGRPGVLHGNKTNLLQEDDGQILEAHSISAGLDYPGIGPELSWLHDVGRAQFLTATDQDALAAFQLCAELEGIIPALESAHAIARLGEVTEQVGKDGIIVVCLSGRGDKDVATVAQALGREI
jgi:tryptophan synthase beta chain